MHCCLSVDTTSAAATSAQLHKMVFYVLKQITHDHTSLYFKCTGDWLSYLSVFLSSLGFFLFLFLVASSCFAPCSGLWTTTGFLLCACVVLFLFGRTFCVCVCVFRWLVRSIWIKYIQANTQHTGSLLKRRHHVPFRSANTLKIETQHNPTLYAMPDAWTILNHRENEGKKWNTVHR